MKLGGIGYGLISGAILGGIVNNDLVNLKILPYRINLKEAEKER